MIDMTGWTANDVGQHYYQQYKIFKKNWRSFVRKSPRRFTKGKGKGSTRRHFFEEDPQAVLFGDKGKGKKGSRGNPKGSDGLTLKCNTCQSEQHLWRQCPMGKGKGKS